MIPNYISASGTLFLGASGNASLGTVVVERSAGVYDIATPANLATFLGCSIGICISSSIVVPGNPIAVLCYGQVPPNLFNVGAGAAGPVGVGGNARPTRASTGQLLGTCSSAGTMFIMSPICGSGYGLAGPLVDLVAGYSFSSTPLSNGQTWVMQSGQLTPTTLPVITNSGTAGQFLIENAAANGAAFTSLTGDVTASAVTPGLTTVGALQGYAISSTSPNNSQILQYLTSTSKWTPVTLSGDVTLSGAVATVGQIQGYAISTTAPTSNQVLQWNSGTNKWTPVSTSTLVTWGSDISGNSTSTGTNQYVSSLSYSSSAAGGAIAINGTGTSLVWAAGNTGPSMSQTSATSGNAGSTLSMTSQAAGSATSGNGLAGGSWSFTAGAGSNSFDTSHFGGHGGNITFTTGAGGNAGATAGSGAGPGGDFIINMGSYGTNGGGVSNTGYNAAFILKDSGGNKLVSLGGRQSSSPGGDPPDFVSFGGSARGWIGAVAGVGTGIGYNSVPAFTVDSNGLLGGNPNAGTAATSPVTWRESSIAVSSASITLTAAQASCPYLKLTGSLLNGITITIPSTVGAYWIIDAIGVTWNSYTIAVAYATTTKYIILASGYSFYLVTGDGSAKVYCTALL